MTGLLKATGQGLSPGTWQIQLAARSLRAGGVIVHATEGVWGLACDPFSQSAVARLLAVKSRQPEKGLIVIGAGAATFQPELATLSDSQGQAVTASWPGAVTWLLPSQRFPHWITGGRANVAVRVPGHDQARALCAAYGGPLVSTSANYAGAPPARNIFQAVAFASREPSVSYLLPGATLSHSAGPSEIRDLEGRIHRAG